MKYLFLILFFLLITIDSFAFDNGFDNVFDKSIANTLKWENPALPELTSDILMSSMLIAPFITSMQGEDKVRKTTVTSLTMIGNWLLTDNVKMRTKRLRPDNSNFRSFFSGHTSTAFTSAGILCFQKKYCSEALILAATTGYLRIAANKHWASDVLVGATIGYLNGRYVPTLIIGF